MYTDLKWAVGGFTVLHKILDFVVICPFWKVKSGKNLQSSATKILREECGKGQLYLHRNRHKHSRRRKTTSRSCHRNSRVFRELLIRRYLNCCRNYYCSYSTTRSQCSFHARSFKQMDLFIMNHSHYQWSTRSPGGCNKTQIPPHTYRPDCFQWWGPKTSGTACTPGWTGNNQSNC